jgi:ribosomal-protein-alanine N-acetyltransferase
MSRTDLVPLSQSVILRPLTSIDEPFLWDILYYAIYIEAGDPMPSPNIIYDPEISKYVANWGQHGDSGVVVIDCDKPVGAAWLRLFSASDKGYGYVADDVPELSIAMLPDYRGKGVGTLVLSTLIDSVHSTKNYSAISLSVSPNNPAMRLYERLGFKTVGMSGTSLVMRLDL